MSTVLRSAESRREFYRVESQESSISLTTHKVREIFTHLNVYDQLLVVEEGGGGGRGGGLTLLFLTLPYSFRWSLFNSSIFPSFPKGKKEKLLEKEGLWKKKSLFISKRPLNRSNEETVSDYRRLHDGETPPPPLP